LRLKPTVDPEEYLIPAAPRDYFSPLQCWISS